MRLPSAEDEEGKASLVITNKEGMEIAIEEGLAVDSYDEAPADTRPSIIITQDSS